METLFIVPVSTVDGVLATVIWASVGVWPAAVLGGFSLAAEEVVFLVKNNDAGLVVGQVGRELLNVLGSNGRCVSSTSGARSEAKSLTSDTRRRCGGGDQGKKKGVREMHVESSKRMTARRRMSGGSKAKRANGGWRKKLEA